MLRKPEPTNVRGMCAVCGQKPQKRKGSNAIGEDLFFPRCHGCHRRAFAKSHRRGIGTERQYTKAKGLVCEECGFEPVHPCQLDVDHKDGDHTNDDPENLWTLCANCHRLKTLVSKDWRARI